MATKRLSSVLALVPMILILGNAVACRAQDPMTAIANSHIEANVPKGKAFDEFLKRDLTSYFCEDAQSCRVEYELLRKGPTQTGIAYPKYYAWVKCLMSDKLKSEGAVRLAAIEQVRFDVTTFIPASEISKDPEQVRAVFPAPLVDDIIKRARHQ